MPSRAFVTKELSSLMGIFSHPHRIRIVEELRNSEKDVNTLQDALGISHSGVSQHLAILRSHRIVTERRQGRHVFYRLLQPDLAQWLVDGLQFLNIDTLSADQLRIAIQEVRSMWDKDADTVNKTKTNGKQHHTNAD
jgi:DNA-binding transcriptional ArsR family regulator